MSAKTDNFISKYKDSVIAASRGTGIFPSVTMAQMIIESGWGDTATAVQANNFFGIKADSSWKGPKKLFNTPNDAVKQNYFRVYTNPTDSIADHEHFLEQNSRYKVHGVFAAKTPEEQVKDLAAAGYAEAGDYANALIHLIDAYNLKSLDTPSASAVSFAKMNIAAIVAGTTLIFTSLYLLTRKTN